MDQLESELQQKKIQVLAMTENHEEVQKELVELREKAEQLDAVSSKAASMEEFLLGLQEERNQLAAQLETAQAQVASLGALLGKAQNAGNAEEVQKALDAARAEHAKELEALRVQIQKRDDELARVQGAMSTLRHAHEQRIAAPPPRDEAAAAAAAAAPAEQTAPASAAAGTAEPKAETAAAPASSGLSITSEQVGAALVSMNVARMEAAKERQSFADKKAFKDPDAFAKAANGKLLGVKNAQGEVVAVCAVVRAGTACELKYVAGEGGEALGELVRAAEAFALESGADQLLTLHNGAMSDAEKKWGSYGFKLNGVGPAPEFMVKLNKALK